MTTIEINTTETLRVIGQRLIDLAGQIEADETCVAFVVSIVAIDRDALESIRPDPDEVTPEQVERLNEETTSEFGLGCYGPHRLAGLAVETVLSEVIPGVMRLVEDGEGDDDD